MIEINLFDNSSLKKIRVCSYDWDEIIKDRNLIYTIIVDLLFKEENLFYYATQKESTKTIIATREYIKQLIEKGLINSNLKSVFQTIGWSNGKLDVNNTRFQGDLAEYLMCIVLDQIADFSTLISKVSLKTSPNVSSFGNDNIFYDYNNEILYYGESKFYSASASAIKDAMNSLDSHFNDGEISYIVTHTNTFIAPDESKRTAVIEKMESTNLEDITIKKIAFIVNDDIYKKNDYEDSLLKIFPDKEVLLETTNEIILVFLPILSKQELLYCFKARLDTYE